MKPSIKGQRMIASFLFGGLVFNYPVLSLFNVDGYVFGIPVLFAYIFSIWLLLILAMAVIVEIPD